MPADPPLRFEAHLRSITNLAQDINSFELVGSNGQTLPTFTAGSHIDLHLRDGMIRQYSLCNDPRETDRYVIAVQREEQGEGGSKAVHDTLQAGDLLTISPPRNNFPLSQDAERHLFLAGGIGITPILSMMTACRSAAAEFELIYCTRSPAQTVFHDRFAGSGNVTLHHDLGDLARNFDLAARLAEPVPGTHVYYCGPTGFMRAVEAATADWPKGTCHFEYFTTPQTDAPAQAAGAVAEGAFQVRLESSGATFDVPPDKSIIEVLRDNGIDVETSCESGLCGTCRTRYLAGTPEHHDLILDDDERSSDVLICCARSLSPLLALDL